ncbi:MAG: hypothetical protein F4W95_06690 [Chloroflexi bacterium]|nr:hypothetical protein [Chloroflexota bacterium]MYD48157.1 hypothetical protein [Chloroflexota bacterium]
MDIQILFTYVALAGILLGMLIMVGIFGLLVYVIFFRGKGNATQAAATDPSPSADSSSEAGPA